MKRKIEASIWLNKSMFGIDRLRFLIRFFCVCGVESVVKSGCIPDMLLAALLSKLS